MGKIAAFNDSSAAKLGAKYSLGSARDRANRLNNYT